MLRELIETIRDLITGKLQPQPIPAWMVEAHYAKDRTEAYRRSIEFSREVSK